MSFPSLKVELYVWKTAVRIKYFNFGKKLNWKNHSMAVLGPSCQRWSFLMNPFHSHCQKGIYKKTGCLHFFLFTNKRTAKHNSGAIFGLFIVTFFDYRKDQNSFLLQNCHTLAFQTFIQNLKIVTKFRIMTLIGFGTKL